MFNSVDEIENKYNIDLPKTELVLKIFNNNFQNLSEDLKRNRFLVYRFYQKFDLVKRHLELEKKTLLEVKHDVEVNLKRTSSEFSNKFKSVTNNFIKIIQIRCLKYKAIVLNRHITHLRMGEEWIENN